MQACFAYNAYMSRKQETLQQLTIRGVSARVKKQLQSRAAREGVSLNSVLVDILNSATSCEPGERRFRDLSGIAGSWIEDEEFERAIEEQDRVDPSIWE